MTDQNVTLRTRPAEAAPLEDDPFAGLSSVLDDIIKGRAVGREAVAAPILQSPDTEPPVETRPPVAPAPRRMPVVTPSAMDRVLASAPKATPVAWQARAAPIGESPQDAFEAQLGMVHLPRASDPFPDADLRGTLDPEPVTVHAAEPEPVAQPASEAAMDGLAASVEALFAVAPSKVQQDARTAIAEVSAPALPVVDTLSEIELASALAGGSTPYADVQPTDAFVIPALPEAVQPEPQARLDDDVDFYDIVRTRGAVRAASVAPIALDNAAVAVEAVPASLTVGPVAVPISSEVPIAASHTDNASPMVATPGDKAGTLQPAPLARATSVEDDPLSEFTAYFESQSPTRTPPLARDPLVAPQPQASSIEKPVVLAPELTDAFDAPDAAVAAAPAAKSGGSRAYWVAAAVLGVAVLGGLGAVGGAWFSPDTAQPGGEPAIVRADNEPVRVAPADPGGTQVPNQDSVVMNEVAGGQAAQPLPVQPELVEGREEPQISGAPVKVEDRVPAGEGEGAAEPEGTLMVAPRAVQTVTVRPDGTLVVEPQAAVPAPAPIAELPADAGAVQSAPRAEADPVQQSEPAPAAVDLAPVAAPPAPTATNVAPVPEPALETAEVPVPAPAPEPAPEPAAAVQAAAPAPQPQALPSAPAVVPDSRPADQPLTIVNPDAQTAEQTQSAEQPVAAPSEQPAVLPGGFAMQISSQPSEAAAMKSLQDLSGRFGSILGGRDYAIQKAQVEGKGTFYRVRILASSREDANALCARYKAAGGSCFVTR
ncbi:MAG: SPOR domain-containing protein [Rhizobiaceae bacterium]|nr:SPOR domain-containing protein [Rhizobiaceae bacterium]